METQNEGTTKDYETTKDIALAGARLSISLASLCLALLAVTVPNTSPTILAIPLPARITLILIGTGLMLSSALIIDWIIDGFSESSWKEVLGNKTDIYKFDQFLARTRLYNGGYLILSLGMALVGGTILSLTPSHLQSTTPNTERFLNIASAAFGGFIFFQMMTYKLGRRIYAIGVLILLVGIVLGANFF